MGVIGFECMTSKRPFKGKDKNKIRDKMLEGQVKVKVENSWDDYPQEAADFINKLIQIKPENRIGSLEEVKAHPWFKDFDWKACINKTMVPIYIPKAGTDNYDSKNVNDHVYTDLKLLEEFETELKSQSAHSQFSEYYLNVETEK